MAQLKEDKKRKIVEFLEQRADEGRLLPLELESIKRQFSDDTYDEESIGKIVNELEEDGLVVKNTAKLEVVYPKKHEKTIEQKFSDLFVSSSIFGYFFAGIILYVLLTDVQPFFEFVYESGLEPEQVIARYAIYGIIGSYLLGKLAVDGYHKLQEEVAVVRDYRYLIYPVLVIGMGSGAVVWLFTNTTGQPVTTTHVVGIITVSVSVGVPIGEFILKNSDEFDNST